MKPDSAETVENADEDSITGDVIGNTVYSERFVLKLLIKLTNLETLQNELQEENIEEDFCTLWDMTAERDVVLFLLKHDALNLFKFAFTAFDSPRIVEVVIGTIGNMCCQNEAVEQLLKMPTFMVFLVEYVKSDDSLVILQLLRLINSSVYLSKNIEIWMQTFFQTEYSDSLYFILNNSSNKDLLITAIENFNTICTQCNIEECRSDFFNHFVTPNAVESITTAFLEMSIKQKDLCQIDEFERMLLITMQIIWNLVGFDKSFDIYTKNRHDLIEVISFIFTYYETKFVDLKEIDMDLVDIIDCAIIIIKCLQLFKNCNLCTFFLQCSRIWQSLGVITLPPTASSFEVDDAEEIKSFSIKIKKSLSGFMLLYMENCTNENLFSAVDEIGNKYEDILSLSDDSTLVTSVSKRVCDYLTRLKETESC